jgi:hypothetical protein
VGFALCSLTMLMSEISVARRGYQSGLVLVYLTSWIIRYILLPHFDVRYSPPQALVLGIIATAGFGIKGSSDIRDGEYPTTGVTECHEVEVTA